MDFGQEPPSRENSTDYDGGRLGPAGPAQESSTAAPGAPVARAAAEAGASGLWGRIKRMVLHYVLQLDGTPHSIALGVFIGFVIGMTPTIGIQMVTYFAVAAMTGANRVSGLLPVWLSNPITAVPLYYFNWRVGSFMMTGDLAGAGQSQDELSEMIRNAPGADMPLVERLVSADFWEMALDLFVALGVELWVGCIAVGLVTGVLGYWATYEGVRAYRRRTAV